MTNYRAHDLMMIFCPRGTERLIHAGSSSILRLMTIIQQTLHQLTVYYAALAFAPAPFLSYWLYNSLMRATLGRRSRDRKLDQFCCCKTRSIYCVCLFGCTCKRTKRNDREGKRQRDYSDDINKETDDE